ncbi:MAG: type II toxin-antitoxin system RelE/ParE family toxin [Sulfuricaulis sp.]|nr:type II toxin-antitoxin system RelE/ParE family toxin [Sulfuricaulis sp.]
MIRIFGNALAEDLFHDRVSRVVRQFPPELRANARRKLQMLDDAETLKVLAALPGNRFEKLKGDRKDRYSIRINDQWRLVFQWQDSHALNVMIEDYH